VCVCVCVCFNIFTPGVLFWGFFFFGLQADIDAEVETVQPKKRTFKKFTFRGVDLDALLDMSSDELVELFHARARRRYGAIQWTCSSRRLVSCPHQMNSAFAICVESLTVGSGVGAAIV